MNITITDRQEEHIVVESLKGMLHHILTNTDEGGERCYIGLPDRDVEAYLLVISDYMSPEKFEEYKQSLPL